MIKLTLALVTSALAITAMPAAAQDAESGGRNVVIGAGIQIEPKFPGASSGKIGVLPLFDTWRADVPQPAEAPDESIGFALIGERGRGLSLGPSFTFASGRSADDLPGLPEVGSSFELGGFAEMWPMPALRLRGELRHGIGGHEALTGDLAADLVWRGAREGTMVTLGPRLRWGSGKYNRTFFSVPAANGAGFTPFEAESGIYSYGAAAGLRVPLGQRFGLFTYVRYDRLTNRVAASPIVLDGSADQFSGGVALTYRFGL
jgi:MipA family protein